ncbi:MAG: 5'-nucleotidase C-terminal domain-containing protein, partial [Gemmatimonadota bacterium]
SSTAIFNTDARIPEGPVTFAELSRLYPYENTLQAIRITGAQLRAYLEASAGYFRRLCAAGESPTAGDCVARAAAGLPAGPAGTDATPGAQRGQGRAEPLARPDVPGYNYDVLAGVEYELDLTRPSGSRVATLRRDGAAVADADSFTLALNNYRAAGGGGFEMLAGAPVVYDRQEDVRELLADWVERRETIRPADVFVRNWRLSPEAAVEPFLAHARGDTVAGIPVAAAVAEDADACAAYRGAEPDSIVHLTLLATNDFHGALEGKTYPWSKGRRVGGAAALAARVAEARAENPNGTLLLDGGDVMQGTPLSNLVQGRSVIDVYNAIGYDAAAIGNHEFDWGIDTLRARIAQARFPFLSANVVRKADGARPAWAVPVALLERKGLRIGVVGLTTTSTPSVTLPANVADLRFTGLAEAVNAAVPGLEARGADLIVVVAHAGGFFETDAERFEGEIVDAMRRMDPAVDAVVSGHTHSLLDGEVNGISLVQSRSSGTALGEVDLFVDARTRDVACADVEVRTVFADEVRPDSSIAAIVARYQEAIDEITRRVVATAAHPLTAGRRRESVLGDLIADAMRVATGTQVALMNSGGIRAELDAGPITWREAFEVQPFANVLYRMELDGRTLRAALENGVSGGHGLVQVSGLAFDVDLSAPSGRRVGAIELEDGTPVYPDSIYTASVNNFMAQGGDDYTMLRDVPAVESTGLIDLDVFVEHLERLPQPIRYDLRRRIRFVGGARPEDPRAD